MALNAWTRLAVIGIFGLVAGPSCAPEPEVEADPGQPLPYLTADELTRFEVGKVMFTKVYTPEEGLGPLYTENSCNACHHEPETGGGGGVPDIHASRFIPPDSCNTLRSEGGFVRKEAIAAMRPYAEDRKFAPGQATEVGQFFSPPLYGHGLIEEIPDETIIALADPDDRDGDGISGRVSWLADGRLGRFRRKADRAVIRDLVDAGLRYAIGLTTPDQPEELPYRGQPIPPGIDQAADPEVDNATIVAVVDFIRFLAPPRRSGAADAADERVIASGERRFEEIGCAGCHTPELRTGPSEVAALDRRMVRLYSDLLLHDMGPELADVCGPTATPSEIRTEILWGLQYRIRFMHDRRAFSLRESIDMHRGESDASRLAFDRLPVADQEAVIRFLQTL